MTAKIQEHEHAPPAVQAGSRPWTAEAVEAAEILREFFAQDAECRVYTALKHRSRSGMQREITVHIARKNRIMDITHLVRCVLGYKRGTSDGLVVRGCGMDMGFFVTYELGTALYGPGGAYALKHVWI